MRKYVKNEIIQIVEQLNKANELIYEQINIIERNELITLLMECQESAVVIGRRIEQDAGEGTRAVNLLEEYCESLYQISMILDNNQKIQELIQKISICLNRVIDSIKNDLLNTKEIVFLPYKASMWDSFESIWKAATEDKTCEVYVVPIPYFDKNSEGTFNEMNYEGDKYPEYVPITHYNDYQFETRCPDAIFIHNPYDEWNRVTSVHPFFYSKNLKRFTNQLVYIPYFITPDVLPEGFCVTPGCINADRIIVQSEEVKENYILAFKKIGETTKQNVFFEDISQKIIALGSPKLEKAYKCEQEKFRLPNTWKKIIQRPDGTKKTIIFYNTSLSVILQNDESYLQKLNQVIEQFSRNKEIVLWWRPHPLSESTIKALRPELFQEYNKIVDNYKKENWGIYDDSPDLYRAIAWCDAYYGDRSSVTMLFTAAQKPVMIQLVKKYTLAFENIVKVNKDYWFTSIGYNALFKLEEGENKAEFIGCFNKEKDLERLYLDIVHYQNKLFFVPFKADSIAVYFIDTKEFRYIQIELPIDKEQEGVKYSDNSKFTFASVNGNNLYLFPGTYPAIIKLNMDSYETEYLYEPINKLGKWIVDTKSVYFRTGIVQGNIVKMWCEPAKAVVEFDMLGKDIKICAQLPNKDKYIEIVSDGEFYWLIPREKEAKLLKLSGDYRIIDSIKLPEGKGEEAVSYIRGFCLEDYLWIIPAAAKHVVKVSLKDSSMEIETIFDNIELETAEEASIDWRFLCAKQIEDEVIVFNNFSQELIRYYTNDNVIRRSQITAEINQNLDANILLDVLMLERGEWKEELSTYFYEGNRGTLQTYIELLQKSKKEMESLLQLKWKESKQYIKGTKNENAGKNIYEYVISDR